MLIPASSFDIEDFLEIIDAGYVVSMFRYSHLQVPPTTIEWPGARDQAP